MACLRPISIINKRYQSTVNNPFPTPAVDDRDFRILVPCGKCFACRRRRQTDWRFRMLQEFKYSDNRKFHFVTLTFSDKSLKKLTDGLTDFDINDVVTRSIRLFLERYRKIYKVSLRHLFVTEKGEKTGRIHLHGIIIGCKCGSYSDSRFKVDIPAFRKIWSYGHVFFGWCTERSISYIIKYMTKDTSDYKPLLLVSPGLGKAYVPNHQLWHHSTPDKIWYCVTSSGHMIAIPRYYALKIFDDVDREIRKLTLWEDPPPMMFRGHLYDDPIEYEHAISSFYQRTLDLKLSLPILRKSNSLSYV